MNIRHHVELSEAERCELTALVGGGKHYARKIKRGQILLAADSGLSDDDIAAALAVGGSTVYRTKRRFVEGNLQAALNEEPRAGADRKLTSNEEALLVATACSSPPEGCARWTLELLAGAMVKLTDHDSLSRETVRRRLAENHLKPWQKDMWCIPKVDAEYVARMEDVLDLYAEQPDPKRPVVCFDESPTQLIGEARQPIPAAPGRPERFDYEYRRNGVVNLFVFLDAPRQGQNENWRAPIPIPRSKSHDHCAGERGPQGDRRPRTQRVDDSNGEALEGGLGKDLAKPSVIVGDDELDAVEASPEQAEQEVLSKMSGSRDRPSRPRGSAAPIPIDADGDQHRLARDNSSRFPPPPGRCDRRRPQLRGHS